MAGQKKPRDFRLTRSPSFVEPTDEDNKAKRGAIVALDTLTWQMLASVFWPGSFIRCVVNATAVAVAAAHLDASVGADVAKAIPTVAGIAAIPFIVKPIDGTQGYDVHLNVHTVTDVCRLCDTLLRAKKRKVIVEEQVQGDNYRVMVHHGKVFDIVKRETASVTGDGVRTVQQLIDARNVQQKARKLFPTHNVDEGHLRKQLQLPAHTDVMAHVLVNGKTVAITNVENYHNGCNTTRVPLSMPLYTTLLSRFMVRDPRPSTCGVFTVFPINTVPGVSSVFSSMVPPASSAS